MKRDITIRILESKFTVPAESPEVEHDIRVAAEQLNEKFYEYLKRNPGKSTEEILSFVALNSFMHAAELEKAVADIRREEDDLHAKLKSYLDNIEKGK